MFGFVSDTIGNVFDILENLVEGEAPTKQQLVKLVSDGVSLYVISEATGLAVDLLEKIMEG